ncbi:translocator protein [Onthophagus taurus]|uniref:translocator protein n=1 Tax=Onthophagus taurus TaxID=166361 RepID=UPI000C20396B|nr:translocator protein [Onthophagus taurus]
MNSKAAICGPIVGSIVLPNAGGFIGYFLVRKNVKPMYEKLNYPEWSPPQWLSSAVWLGLYSGIGYGSYLVYKTGGGLEGPAKLPLTMYAANLVANWAYCPIFFGCGNSKMALIDIGLIEITAIGTGFLFHQVNKTAGYLFIPYILWMGYVAAYNYKIFKNNKPEVKVN